MLSFSAFGLLVLTVGPALCIPPPDFGFPEAPNDTALAVTYPNNGSPLVVAEAQLFGVTIPSQEPTVAVDPSRFESIATYNGSYTLIMVDPDARYPEEPTSRFILHWLQTNMTTAQQAADGTTQLINNTQPRAPYRGPGPPTNSSAHRYILYAFFQHENFTFPPAFEGYNATNRTSFNLTEFLDQSNLGQTAAAAMYFFASNQTGVPPDFVAAAGATYPGGNGAMITEGPGPSITPSSTPATATASATGASSEDSNSASESGGASATESAASPSPSSDAVKTRAGLGMVMLACTLIAMTLA
ncbi:hypothetical protein G647_08086 [Cladophialophora carrionii CBS 160.54]|uniref:YbhB/YbcL family Raf kinase inhibitor-like protein n=1 Tax=Cladophialophora carrionii CBS 160.54 TaxID=1279043 RepID=V9D4A6_9EURO|nr:uncharacterized protein G647_08086 [Cladophialophora carrionii CBS 160.54]ETI21739.1 hypothetical protein G647_08086 [Cladophialophora carrionii CBS 160.54]